MVFFFVVVFFFLLLGNGECERHIFKKKLFPLMLKEITSENSRRLQEKKKKVKRLISLNFSYMVRFGDENYNY